MEMKNTHDLSSFMDRLKEWGKTHQYAKIVSEIENAEAASMSASELIIRYGEALEDLRSFIPESLPASFRDHWDRAVTISKEAVQTVQYEEKTRSIFSLG